MADPKDPDPGTDDASRDEGAVKEPSSRSRSDRRSAPSRRSSRARGARRPDPFDDPDPERARRWVEQELASAEDAELSAPPPHTPPREPEDDEGADPDGRDDEGADPDGRDDEGADPDGRDDEGADPDGRDEEETTSHRRAERSRRKRAAKRTGEEDAAAPETQGEETTRTRRRAKRPRRRRPLEEDGDAPRPKQEPRRPSGRRSRPARRDEDLDDWDDADPTDADPTDADPTHGELAPRRGEAETHRRKARRRTGRAQRAASRAVDDLDDLDEVDLADLPPPPRSLLRRPPWWGLLGALLLALVVAGVLMGEWNEQRYFLVCSDKGAEGHQGRGFPWPFGHHRLDGIGYRTVRLSSAAQCSTAELGSKEELDHALLALVQQELARRWPIETPQGIEKARHLLAQGVALGRGEAKTLAKLSGLEARLDVGEASLILREARRVVLRAKDRLDRARSHGLADPGARATLTRLTGLVAHLLARLDAGRAPAPPPTPGVPPRRVRPPGTEPHPPAAPLSSAARPTRSTPSAARPGARDVPHERPTAVPSHGPDAGVQGGGLLL